MSLTEYIYGILQSADLYVDNLYISDRLIH